MAKSSRSRTIKANNRRLKSKVFGPVEAARTQRLSARLVALAAQAKPAREPEDVEMTLDGDGDGDGDGDEASKDDKQAQNEDEGSAMDIDDVKPTITTRPGSKKRGGKLKTVSKIIFPKYGERHAPKRRKHR